MQTEHDSKRFLDKLAQFSPDFDKTSRSLAIISASIAIGDEAPITAAIRKGIELGNKSDEVYEIVLQSYLFLGFPRMLTAAECFQESFPEYARKIKADNSITRFKQWEERGLALCQKVYGRNFDKLKDRLRLFSPEIFDWTILEGYGKVLSRPGVNITARELAIVACLIVDERPKQLFSHIRGALNVGVSEALLTAVIGDVESVSGADSEQAMKFLNRLKIDD